MAAFTEKEIITAWNNASAPPKGYDGRVYRLDSCGALIYWPSYGKDTDMGWEVDHVFPKNLGGKNDSVNLRAMHHRNNSSKGNSYPNYSCAVSWTGKSNTLTNRTRTVHEGRRKKLANLYGSKVK